MGIVSSLAAALKVGGASEEIDIRYLHARVATYQSISGGSPGRRAGSGRP